MKLGLNMKTSLSQTLTPQQIQYLKLLQLPLIQLEQHVQQQIEANPMLDDASFDDDEFDIDHIPITREEENSTVREEMLDRPEEAKQFDESNDPFEFQKLLWDGTTDADRNSNYSGNDDEDDNEMPYKSSTSESESLVTQLRLLKLTKEEYVLGEQIIGNVDNDGYLRRDLKEIVFETNQLLAELNYQLENSFNEIKEEAPLDYSNPAKQFALEDEEREYMNKIKNITPIHNNGISAEQIHDVTDESDLQDESEVKSIIDFEPFEEVTMKHAEKVLYSVQHLDPPDRKSVV